MPGAILDHLMGRETARGECSSAEGVAAMESVVGAPYASPGGWG